jgi:VCBS repeat-containing protein
VMSADVTSAHALTEQAGLTGSASPDTASASLAFHDVDLSDTHTISIGSPQATWSAGDVPASTVTALNAALTSTLTDSTHTGAGTVALAFSAADSAFDFLAAGETLKVTYNVTVDDGHGGTSTQPVTITITGSNDGPVVAADTTASHALSEVAGQTGADAADLASANLTFTDVDLSDTHSVSIGSAQATWSAGAVPASAISALNGALTSTLTDSTHSGAGSVALAFSAADKAFDFLGVGEALTVTYAVTVTDNHGATSTQPVTFTVTSAVTSGAITEDAHSPGPETATGTIAFADADLTDHHTVTAAFHPHQGMPQLGALTPVITTDANGQGVVTWSYSANDSALQQLSQGQTVIETFTVTVNDGHGGLVSQDVSVTVTGTNDQPVLAAGPNLSGAISFYGAEGNTVDSIGANNGTSHGVVYAAGHDGQAFNFTGSNYVTIPNQTPANFTIEGWVKTSANSLTGTQFFQGNGLVYADVGGLQKDFGISILNNHLAFGTGGNFDSTIQSTSVVNTGDWVNFAAVRSGSIISIYINGHLEASEDTTYSGLLNAPALINLGANTIDGRYFTGELDDLSIYNRALSAAEIQQHAVMGSATMVEPSDVTGASTPLSGSVSLTLTDADLGDTHGAAISAPVLSWSGGALPDAVASALANVASAVVATDTVGTGAGAVTVTFAAPQSTFDFLAAGQTLTATYTVTVSDGNGGTASQPVTFTVIGTNDAASISGTESGAVQEDGALSVAGTLSVADADSGEAHFLAPTPEALHGTYGTFTFNDGAWTYALNNGAANVQALNSGQTVHDTLVVTSADGTASKTIDVTIAGQNEPQLVQLLSNNSFEGGNISSTQIPGWTNLGGTFLEVVGQTFLGIGGDGHLLDTQGTPGGITIAQTIDVATGDHATLSFSVAAELTSSGLHPGSTLSFTWDGVVVKTITEDDFRDANGNMQWNTLKTFTVDVVGQAGADTLSIHDSGTALVGYALDWVKVQEWIVT